MCNVFVFLLHLYVNWKFSSEVQNLWHWGETIKEQIQTFESYLDIFVSSRFSWLGNSLALNGVCHLALDIIHCVIACSQSHHIRSHFFNPLSLLVWLQLPWRVLELPQWQTLMVLWWGMLSWDVGQYEAVTIYYTLGIRSEHRCWSTWSCQDTWETFMTRFYTIIFCFVFLLAPMCHHTSLYMTGTEPD